MLFKKKKKEWSRKIIGGVFLPGKTETLVVYAEGFKDREFAIIKNCTAYGYGRTYSADKIDDYSSYLEFPEPWGSSLIDSAIINRYLNENYILALDGTILTKSSIRGGYIRHEEKIEELPIFWEEASS